MINSYDIKTGFKWSQDVILITIHEMHFSVDSIMLLEEGFEVVSVDASDKMLKYALKERWSRRTEPSFNNWGEWFDYYYYYVDYGRHEVVS